MDCALCRQMALRIRAEAGENCESPCGSAASSVASSRKASVVPSVSIGKREERRRRNDLASLIADKGSIDPVSTRMEGLIALG